ncbi:hypothetical protein V3C99_004591, partial [Haemonchus contortus]
MCYASVIFTILNGTIDFGSPESENPLGCELWDFEKTEIRYPKDEKEFLQYEGEVEAKCYCNQTAICATQPETFESMLNTQRSNSPYYAIKAAEIVLKSMRAGEMPNNAATSSTPTSTTKATTAEASTVETTTTTETSSTFATASDNEYSDTSTTSAYDDSSTVTDTG